MSEPSRLGPQASTRLTETRLPLVQRDDSLRVLGAAYSEITAGRGGIVILSGESGIGKSVLLRSWLSSLPPEQPRFSATCFSDEHNEPYAVWSHLCSDFERIRSALPQPLGDAEPPAHGEADLQSRSLRALLALAQDGPFILALDDLQWADPHSLGLVRALARQVERASLLVVACIALPLDREDPLSSVLPELLRLPNTAMLELGPLDRAAVRALVTAADIPSSAQGTSDITGWLMEMCQGHPLFTVELLRSIEHDPQMADVARHQGIALPVSLAGLIEQRLSGLDDDALRTLSIAALVGSDIDPNILAQALLYDYDRVIDDLDRALTAGLLIEEPEGVLRFRHQIIREALITRQPRLRRRQLHTALLPSLQAAATTSPRELARHAEAAGDLELAVDTYERVADRDSRLFAMREAARALERAVELSERAKRSDDRHDRLLLALADAMLRFDRPRATRIVDQVEGRALVREDRRTVALARGRQATLLYEAGRRSEAVDLLNTLLPDLEKLDETSARADALMTLGYCAVSESDFGLVERAAEQLLTLSEELESPLHRAVALWLLAVTSVARGTPAGAAQMGRESVVILTELGRLDLATAVSTVVFVRVDLFANLHRPEMVADLARLGEELDRTGDLRIGFDPEESFCTPEFCLWRFLTGEWERGLADLPDPEALANAPHPQVLRDVAHTVAAEFDLARGEVERGERRLRYIAPHPDAPLGEHSYQQWLMAADRLATLELERGDLERAQAWMGALDRALELKPHVPGELMLQSLLADLDLLSGNAQQAAARYEEVVERARQTNNVLARLRGLRGLAMANYRVNRHDNALRLAQQAIDAAGQARLVYERALSQLTLAEIGLAGKPGDTVIRSAVEEAVATLRNLGAARMLGRAEALLEPRRRGNGPLTARELQIVELVAAGHTDTEIADRLYISRRTVNTHLTNIYGKTGISNRVELVTWAIANGYVTPRG